MAINNAEWEVINNILTNNDAKIDQEVEMSEIATAYATRLSDLLALCFRRDITNAALKVAWDAARTPPNYNGELLALSLDIGNRLLPAFAATPSGVPMSKINTKTGKTDNYAWNSGMSVLAEVGSSQLEFAYLSYHTKDPKYHVMARKVFSTLHKIPPTNKDLAGMYPVFIDHRTAMPAVFV